MTERHEVRRDGVRVGAITRTRHGSVFLRAALLVLAACRSPDVRAAPDAGAPEPPPRASADPNDPFAPYPGSQELCNRLIVAEGRPLHWRSWTTPDDMAKVADHYKARAKAERIQQGTEKLQIRIPPDRVLMVYPVALASAHPQCDKPLAPEDKTVIMVSEMRMPP